MVVDVMRTRLLSGSNVKYGAAKGTITPKDTMINNHQLPSVILLWDSSKRYLMMRRSDKNIVTNTLFYT
ncbi:hypothetical protein ABES25_01445 [Bacillus gobiensis]|uniref:hypothetical protein n=1 Tax=Bacillus gobiensis TaxID=1441095 RepID=UPI003D241FB4